MRIGAQASSPSRSRSRSAAPPCAQDPALYAHPQLETPPVRSKVTQAVWREYRTLLDDVRERCAACPLFVDCLYRAVAEVEVSGYVGCTTPRERREIRRTLGHRVEADDLDEAAGVRAEGRPLDYEHVLATRRANPDDTFEQLAQRLGCSLSTIKRHLRRARREAEATAAGEASRPTPSADSSLPSVDDVLDAFDAVVEDDR